MEIVRFIYEHWVLTSWFLVLLSSNTLIKFIKK